MYDYGFDFPDCRYTFIDQAGEDVKVVIVRHWRACDNDDEETTFDCSFDIVRGRERTSLPIGVDESKAISIAHSLYAEDEVATRENDAAEAECAAERRAGC